MFEVTKEFIAALKAADRSACVFMKQSDDEADTRHHVMIRFSASLSVKVRPGFVPETAALYAETTAEFTYRERGPIDSEYRAASFVNLYPCGRGGWGALALILRPGDLLTLTALDNRNDYLKERDLHADTLYATVTRKGKLVIDALPLEFSGGCPDNSARSLKR